MRFLLKIIFLLFVSSFILPSCKKTTSWDVDAAFPIAKSYLNISNFFGDTIFKADANNLLHIAFSKDIVNYTMDSLVKLPDTTVDASYVLAFYYNINPGTQIYTNATSSTREITFDVNNGVELNTAIIRSGAIKIEFSNTCSQPLNFNYDINSATKWGNVFHINQTVPANTNSFIKYYLLDGYSLNFRGLNTNQVNTLVQTYTISADVSGQTDTIKPMQGLGIKLSYVNIIPEYIQGYFGQQDLSFGPDSSKLDFLGNVGINNLALTQSSINFRIINEFGIEMSSAINSVKSIKTTPTNIISLNAGTLLSTININRATKTNNASNPVFPFVKQINVNSTNSNLNPFLQNLPNYLGYSIKATINPLGNISAGNDFAYYGKGLRVIADVDIPLKLSANYFKLENFSKVDLTQLKEIRNVNACQIFVDAINNYPFKAQLQGYLLNDQNQIIDSLFLPGQNFIQSASTNLNNDVLNPINSQLIAEFDKSKIEHLTQCKQIKFVSYMFLQNQPTPIKINNDSYLDVTVSANVNYNVTKK